MKPRRPVAVTLVVARPRPLIKSAPIPSIITVWSLISLSHFIEIAVLVRSIIISSTILLLIIVIITVSWRSSTQFLVAFSDFIDSRVKCFHIMLDIIDFIVQFESIDFTCLQFVLQFVESILQFLSVALDLLEIAHAHLLELLEGPLVFSYVVIHLQELALGCARYHVTHRGHAH